MAAAKNLAPRFILFSALLLQLYSKYDHLSLSNNIIHGCNGSAEEDGFKSTGFEADFLPEPIVFKTRRLIEFQRYLGSRISYYPNSCSSFQLTKVLIGGDVSPNPGPEKCSECGKTIAKKHRSLTCDSCRRTFHMKCGNKRVLKDFNILQRSKVIWICTTCTFAQLPFNGLNASAMESLWLRDQAVSNDVEQCNSPAETTITDQCCMNDESESWLMNERINTPNEFLVVHLNVNGIQSKFDELKILNGKLKAHIIFLSETKIDSSYPSAQFHMEGYRIYRKDRAKGGGGLMAFCSSMLTTKQAKLPTPYKLIEVLAVNVTVNNNHMLFVGIYRPPKVVGLNYYGRLEQELNSVFTWATMECNTVILTGDLNLDRSRPELREGQILLNLEDVYGFECLVTEPTRVTCSSATLLDVILTNKPELFKKSGVLNPEISDHYLTYGLMRNKISQYRHKVVSFRSTKSLDIDKFNDELITAPWGVMDIFDTLEDKCNYWESLFTYVVDTHMPKKRMRFRQADVAYMTTEWKRDIRKKRMYAKQFARNKSDENWELKRKWRNEATKLRRKAIRQYWQTKADHLKSKPGDFYKAFKPFLSDKPKDQSRTIIEIRRNDGRVERDQRNVSNLLVNYFASIADNIGGVEVNMLNEEDLSDHSSLRSIERICEQSPINFNFSEISILQVQSALENLKVNKAAGWDTITPKMLKYAAKGVADPLTKLFNMSIGSGQWPEDWKKGEWSPVYKKDDRLDVRNYRPITILSTVDKVFEQLLSRQIYNQFENILILASQHIVRCTAARPP